MRRVTQYIELEEMGSKSERKIMERILSGRTAKEEEIFRLLDDCRKKRMTPDKALRVLQDEMGIEPRLGMIWLRRHTSCFPDANK